MTKDERYKKILGEIITISSKIGWETAKDNWKKFDPLRLALNYRINEAIEMNREKNN